MGNRIATFACFWAVLVGCAGEPARYDGPAEPTGPTVREQLQGRRGFQVAPTAVDGGGSFVSAELTGALTVEPVDAVLPVVGGALTARTDRAGRMQLEQLVVELADVVLDDRQFPPRGLWLSGLRLRLVDPVVADAVWTDDDQACAVIADFDLRFDWGVVLADGTRHPLATQTLRDLPFEIDVARRGPLGIGVSLGAYAEGVVWRWSELVEVSNLSVDVLAISETETGTGG